MIVLIGTEGLPTVPYNGVNSLSRYAQSIFLAKWHSSCSGFIKLVSTVLNISNCGCFGNFFNMICRVLIKYNQKLHTFHTFKEHKILTVNVLIIVKDQLPIIHIRLIFPCFEITARNSLKTLKNTGLN